MPVLAIGIGPAKGKMNPPPKPGAKPAGPPPPPKETASGPPPPPAADKPDKPPAAPPDTDDQGGGDALAQAHEHLEQIFSGDSKVGNAIASLLSAICTEEQGEGEGGYGAPPAGGGGMPGGGMMPDQG